MSGPLATVAPNGTSVAALLAEALDDFRRDAKAIRIKPPRRTRAWPKRRPGSRLTPPRR
jgi:hypothetical protein